MGKVLPFKRPSDVTMLPTPRRSWLCRVGIHKLGGWRRVSISNSGVEALPTLPIGTYTVSARICVRCRVYAEVITT